MTLRTSIITAGAILALVAPAAANARAITNLEGDVAVAVKSGHGLATHKSSKHKSSKTKTATSPRPDDRSGPFGP